ncbi:hypothetical protein MKW98_017794 [Papaver atlanticum]|uniref:WRKY domain-containing protein n=1 Tax=Papaver atlanticum TaxID=357466 RepID=A0AAD4TEY8_9MAGN|nr:hypothetical protein MKW98_017794 [Papaver atlanticum]
MVLVVMDTNNNNDSLMKMKRSSPSSGFGADQGVAIKREKSTSNGSSSNNTDRENRKELQLEGGVVDSNQNKGGNTKEKSSSPNKPSSPNQRLELISFNNLQAPKTAATVRSSAIDTNSNATSSSNKNTEDDQLVSAKAEMSQVKQENERLKTTLSKVVKDYQSLQMHFFDIVQREQTKQKSTDTTAVAVLPVSTHHKEIDEEPELISLSLGRSNSAELKKFKDSSSKSKDGAGNHEDDLNKGLALGLGCKFEVSSNAARTELITNQSPENSFEELKEEEVVGEQWPPSKILKTVRSGDDELSQQNQVKKARVSVRARCDTPTMNDGCQWRKYGQKIAKGNPCPRAYYRCTVAPACPVRKQVQRCAENMSILITTYEGTHNHPLPIAATAMASTTSAAACMLLSGSTSSRPNFGTSATTGTSGDLNGLSFNISDNSRSRPFYIPNSSISSSPSYPTITLDLTAPPALSSSTSSAASQFSRLSSNFPTTRYSSTSLNFSSGSESSTLPTSWGNGYLSYGNQPYNKSQLGSLNLGRQTQENFYQPYFQKNAPPPPQQNMTESIAAATKAITSDPSFRSALAAAITSIVNGGAVNGNQAGGENVGQNLKWE